MDFDMRQLKLKCICGQTVQIQQTPSSVKGEFSYAINCDCGFGIKNGDYTPITSAQKCLRLWLELRESFPKSLNKYIKAGIISL